MYEAVQMKPVEPFSISVLKLEILGGKLKSGGTQDYTRLET
jgi:hypothetical protein